MGDAGRRTLVALAWLCSVGFFGLGLTGCNPFASYCSDAMECVGGNDADIDACIVDAETAEDRAAVWGCEAEFDALVDCIEAESKCENNSEGNKRYTTDGDCDNEEEDLDECTD
jgi:hypothetical protein